MLGSVGVAGGMSTTLMLANFSPSVLTQALVLISVGGAVGLYGG